MQKKREHHKSIDTAAGSKENFTSSLMYLLHQVTFLAEKRLEKKLGKNSPLSFSQFVILMGIGCQEGRDETSQSMLAEFLHVTEATISRHLKGLEKDGLLTKEKSGANKKMKILTLTKKGGSVLLTTEKIVRKELDSIFSSLKTEESLQVMNALEITLKGLVTKY